MSRLVKVFKGLKSAGLSEDEALMWAERINGRTTKVRVSGPTTSEGRVANGGTSLKEDIIAYARSRKGNVFTLANMSAKLGVQGNSISAQLTHLVKNGVLSRTGRGEYVLKQHRTAA